MSLRPGDSTPSFRNDWDAAGSSATSSSPATTRSHLRRSLEQIIEAPAAFLITGISATGKSTVGELLATRFERGVHVKGDVYRRMVVSGRVHMRPGAPPEAERQLDLRYRLGAQTADAFFEAGFTVVVQDIVMGPALSTYVDRIRARPLHVVVLTPRPEVVAAREATRVKTAYQPDGPTIADLDDYLRTQTPRIGLWIDSSDQTPDQTVAEILERREDARV